MVADTTYYDALSVPTNASELDIKKAYRKLAVTTHPGSSVDSNREPVADLALQTKTRTTRPHMLDSKLSVKLIKSSQTKTYEQPMTSMERNKPCLVQASRTLRNSSA